MNNLDIIIEAYNCEVGDIPRIHREEGGGKARNASGVLFENFIERVCADNNLVAKKNDYKRSKEIDGLFVKNLQVDKHIYRSGFFKNALECKAYLDSCYLKRAVLDFIELHESPDVPNDVEYAIFAGQNCVSEDTLKYYLAYFKSKTNKDLNIFIVNKQKKRSASKAIYMENYSEDFQLDITEVNKFVEWLNK